MYLNRKIGLIIFAIVLCLQAAYPDESETKVSSKGFVFYQFGQVPKTSNPNQNWNNKTYDQRFDFRLSMDATIQEHLRVVVAAELVTGTTIFIGADKNPNPGAIAGPGVYPKEGQGIYSFGDPENSYLQIALGYFPFKYDPQATNMGEYLFRTGTYPPYIINDFDNCMARLLGLRVSSNLLDGALRLDGLLTNETYYYPIGDYSISFLAGYKVGKLLDVGTGVSLSHFLPADAELTTPKGDNLVREDQTTDILPGDSLYYTFKGVKLMARVSFDPKQLLSSPTLFGRELGDEDGKLYAEMAVLGLTDYGLFFNDLLKRTPVMVGFNVPCFKVLDVFSMELEYFGFPYDIYTSFPNGTTPSQGLAMDQLSSPNMFHWSIYAQKTLVKGLSVKGLIGKDHFRVTDGAGNPQAASNAGELTMGQNDWHYMIRCMYSF